MKTSTGQDPLSAPSRVGRTAAPRAAACFFDPELFQEFVDILGRAKARFWLGTFRDGLIEEFAQPPGQAHDPATSRATVHNFVAQAGLTGFSALHEACLHFLESGEERDDAYLRLRAQTERAIPQIERLRETLG